MRAQARTARLVILLVALLAGVIAMISTLLIASRKVPLRHEAE